MYTLKEASSIDEYDAFWELKCQKDAVKWSGYEKGPDYDSFKQYYIERILNNNQTHVMFLYDEDVPMLAGYTQYDDIEEGVIEVRGTTIKRIYQGTDAIDALNKLIHEHYVSKGVKKYTTWASEKNIPSCLNLKNNGWIKTDQYDVRTLPLLGGEHKFYKWIKETE